MNEQNAVRRDGRRARSDRSRNAIATAMLELIVSGTPHPSARLVAERAGVSPRLVFHHFKDMDALYRELMSLQAERLQPLMEMDLDLHAPLEERLAGFVDHRVTLLEFISPVRKVIIGTEVTSPVIAAELDRLRAFKRNQTAMVFSPEISRLSTEQGGLVSSALQAAASWSTWHSLRHHQKLPLEKAEQVLAQTIRSLLNGIRPLIESDTEKG